MSRPSLTCKLQGGKHIPLEGLFQSHLHILCEFGEDPMKMYFFEQLIYIATCLLSMQMKPKESKDSKDSKP
jgi:hypothetical protein